MGIVWYTARSDLRRHLRGAVALVVLVGLAAGLVIACVAGARRTASAMSRMVEATEAADILVSPNGEGTGTLGFYDAIEQLDAVEEVGPLIGMPVGIAAGERGEVTEIQGPVAGPLDERFGGELGRPNLLSGRVPRPDRTDEVLVNRFFAEEMGVEVGDRLDLVLSIRDGDAIPIPSTVVGIGVLPQEVVPFTDLDAAPSLLMSSAVAAMVPRGSEYFEGAVIEVRPGAAIDETIEKIQALAADHEDALGSDPLFVVNQSEAVAKVQESIRPLVVALALFGSVLGLVAAVVVGQALRRHLELVPAEAEARRALGITAAQMRRARMARGAVIGVAAAGLAVVVAVLGSQLFPIGPARLAETAPGIRLDVWPVAGGALVVVLFCWMAATPAGRRRSTQRAGGLQRRVLGSPAATSGLRAAVGGDGRGTASGVALTAVVGVAAVAATLTFSTSLGGLVERPERYGQSWDRLFDGQFGPAPAGEVVTVLEDDERVAGLAGGTYGEVVLGDERITAISWSPLDGQLEPVVLHGRWAQAPGEIALGGEVMERHGVSVGDVVTVDAGDGPVELEVVGSLVFPRFGLGSFGTTGLGQGAQLHPDDLAPSSMPALVEVESELAAMGVDLHLPHEGALYNFVAIDVMGDPAALDDELIELGGPLVNSYYGLRVEQHPTTISDLRRVRSVPLLLSAALAALAAATLAHGLSGSLRSRRRELAVLKTLGFRRHQVASTVLWHSGAVAVTALVVGTPLGLAAGRRAWSAYADTLYAPAAPVTSLVVVVAVVTAALAISGAVATPPAVAAARIRPAAVLRSE